jgi:hypothetical protein
MSSGYVQAVGVEMIFDEGRLRELIERRTVRVCGEDYQLRLVGFSETPNHALMLAVAISGIDERLQLHVSDDLRRDPIALTERVVYFAKRIVIATRQRIPTATSPAGSDGASKELLSD